MACDLQAILSLQLNTTGLHQFKLHPFKLHQFKASFQRAAIYLIESDCSSRSA